MNEEVPFNRGAFWFVLLFTILALSSARIPTFDMAPMTSQLAATTSAVSNQCATSSFLTIISSISTIVKPLPQVTNTKHTLITATISDGLANPYTTIFLQAQERISSPAMTEYSLVTYATCHPTTTSSSSKAVQTTTPTAALSTSSDLKVLIISITVCGVTGCLAMALTFWLWCPRRRKGPNPLELSHGQSMELIGFPYTPDRATRPKRSLETTEPGSDLSGTTLKDYVGSMPSISQRGLTGIDMDMQSVANTRWSSIQRAGVGLPFGRIHNTDDIYQRTESALRLSAKEYNPYAGNNSSFCFSESSNVKPGVSLTVSYQSRGSSAFIPPSNSGVENAPTEKFPSRPPERVFSPSIYSQDVDAPIQPLPTQDPERVVSASVHSQRDPLERVERAPNRQIAWDVTLRTLEGIHERNEVDFTRYPTADSRFSPPGHGTEDVRKRSPVRSEDGVKSDDGDYETVMYDSDSESRIRRAQIHGRDNINGSIYSVDRVLERIANEPPRTRERK